MNLHENQVFEQWKNDRKMKTKWINAKLEKKNDEKKEIKFSIMISWRLQQPEKIVDNNSKSGKFPGK